jgi:hypothetical protein
MNPIERRLLEIAKRGREEFGFLALKAEFEAEGTRTDELLRLLEIARRAEVGVGLKIGGCEAVRDLLEARQFGVDYIIAPMVETAYALGKYIDAKDKVYRRDGGYTTKFLFNIETITAQRNLDAMIDLIAAKGGVDGLVFGRVDFAGSLGLQRSAINGDAVTDHIRTVAQACRDANLELVVGGGVTPEAIEALREARKLRLDRFETRKIIFDAAILDGDAVEDGMALAIEFELLWLQNKATYYHEMSLEDRQRISMLEARAAKANSGDPGVKALVG